MPRKPPKSGKPTKPPTTPVLSLSGHIRRAAGRTTGTSTPPVSEPVLTPRQRADDLHDRAMDAESDEEFVALMQQAVAAYPGHVEAQLALLQSTAYHGVEQVKGLRRIVALGAEDLGAEFVAKHHGTLWMEAGARPYLRAREALAVALVSIGHDDEAIAEYQELLTLTTDDRSGVRYPLIGLLLEQGRIAEAGKLLDRFGEDTSPSIAWSRVLERFLAGDLAAAAQALGVARRRNLHLEEILAARQRIPVRIADGARVAAMDQALHHARDLAESWRRHPEAVLWLRQQPQAPTLMK
jgi:tetratricopeptide (TPR) repeat protein